MLSVLSPIINKPIICTLMFITPVEASSASIAIIHVCVFVCPHDKTKMAETALAS